VAVLGLPHFQHIGGALRADSVVCEDFFRGGDCFRSWKDNRFGATTVEFESHELVFEVPKECDEMAEAAHSRAVD
jgi:hypothetical protein